MCRKVLNVIETSWFFHAKHNSNILSEIYQICMSSGAHSEKFFCAVSLVTLRGTEVCDPALCAASQHQPLGGWVFEDGKLRSRVALRFDNSLEPDREARVGRLSIKALASVQVLGSLCGTDFVTSVHPATAVLHI